MKLALKILLAGGLIAFSCNNNTDGSQTGDDTAQRTVLVPPPVDTTLSGCYSLITGRDTASLQLQRNGSGFSGSLSYNIYEKDRNDGTYQADMLNGTITGWYLFRSEGKMSVRQEVFKIENGKLWPATGEVGMRNDTAFFSKPQQLVFDSVRAFVKVPCTI